MAKPRLRRELGLPHAVMLGIGGTLSAGNFVILGHAASLAGSSLVYVTLFSGIISFLTMLSYSELGTAIPRAGGEYTFAKVAYGGFAGFLTGWFEWLSNVFYASLSSIGFAYVISYFVPINIALAAVFMVIVFTIINTRGVKEMGATETILTLAVLSILAVYVFVGWQYTQGINSFTPTMPGGFLGIFAATAYLFELYLGAEAIAVAQAEIRNPEKTIPRAMILSSIALIAIYTSIVYVTVRVGSTEILAQKASPMAFVAEQFMGLNGALLVTIALAIAGLAALNEAIMAQSRVLYALSRDGYFPKALSKIDSGFGTPVMAIVVSSIFTLALTATGFLNFVVYAVNLGFIIGFTMVNLSVIKLRRERPQLKRPFKVPLYPFTPIAGIVASLMLLAFIDPVVLLLGFELSVFALLVYYVRMVGYHRFRAAFGGISLSLGGFAALLAYLIITGSVSFSWLSLSNATSFFYILLCVSAIQIIAGILNLTAKTY